MPTKSTVPFSSPPIFILSRRRPANHYPPAHHLSMLFAAATFHPLSFLLFSLTFSWRVFLFLSFSILSSVNLSRARCNCIIYSIIYSPVNLYNFYRSSVRKFDEPRSACFTLSLCARTRRNGEDFDIIFLSNCVILIFFLSNIRGMLCAYNV